MKQGLLILLSLLLAAVAWADQPNFQLTELRWKHRILLVFTPHDALPSYQRQRAEWERAKDGMKERDLLWITLSPGQAASAAGRAISPASQQQLRRDFGVKPGEFVVILVGLDGGTKLRAMEPVGADSLFALIDSMPMRQNELQRDKSRAQARPNSAPTQ